MAQIVIPDNELNSFDLPRVCVITGATENVVFKPVKFSWYPRWIPVLVLVNLLIAAIVAAVLTRRVQGELPFTEEAWKAWRLARILQPLSIVGMFALGILSIPAFTEELPVLGFLALAAALALPIAVTLKFARGKGVTCVRIADGSTTLTIPSGTAALAIAAHLRGGRASAPAVRAA